MCVAIQMAARRIAGQTQNRLMTKNKKTNAKAPAQAKVSTPIAQPVVVKTPVAKAVAAKPVEAVKPVQAVKPVEPAKPVAAPKAAPAPAPVQPKVRLEFSKPGAQSVAIAGSFNSWQPEQAKTTGNGGWVKELTIAPGRYEYMLVVDGQWMADPNAKESVPNPFGGQNSVLVISK